MLNTLIIISLICWVSGFIINGFTLYNILIIVPTIMFLLRKFGIHNKLGTIITAEILFLICSVVWRLLFKKLILFKLAIGVLLRIIFICVVIYDDMVYVYVQEERKRNDK